MSDICAPIMTEVPRRRARWRSAPWQIALVSPLAGATVGAVARWWMRLITDEPEFSWSGTIFIVGAFTIAGVGHGVAWAARRADARRRWSTSARVVGAVMTLPIFAGAGAIMLPTVLCGSLARDRTDWWRPVRAFIALVALAAPTLVLVDVAGGGLSLRRALGAVLFVGTYAAVIMSMRAIVAPVADGWRMPRAVRILLVVVTTLVVLFLVTLVVGFASADA